jgi:predicted DNA-binding transcriptional regulator YafY
MLLVEHEYSSRRNLALGSLNAILSKKENDGITARNISDKFGCDIDTARKILLDIEYEFPRLITMEVGKNGVHIFKRQTPIPEWLIEPTDEESLLWLTLAAAYFSQMFPENVREHLLTPLYEATKAFDFGREILDLSSFQFLAKGSVNYEIKDSQNLVTLVKALTSENICQILYQNSAENEKDILNNQGENSANKVMLVLPAKLICYYGSIHVYGFRIQKTKKGKCKFMDDYGRQVLLHHIEKVEIEEDLIIPAGIRYPINYSNDGTFGVFKKSDPGTLRVIFSQNVARYIEERTWSADQLIEKKSTGKYKNCPKLTISYSDQAEVLNWLLSFGPELIKVEYPDSLRKAYKKKVISMGENIDLKFKVKKVKAKNHSDSAKLNKKNEKKK